MHFAYVQPLNGKLKAFTLKIVTDRERLASAILLFIVMFVMPFLRL